MEWLCYIRAVAILMECVHDPRTVLVLLYSIQCFQVIKNVPVERYTRQESVIAYWLIGTYFGKAVSNNKKVLTSQLPLCLPACSRLVFQPSMTAPTGCLSEPP